MHETCPFSFTARILRICSCCKRRAVIDTHPSSDAEAHVTCGSIAHGQRTRPYGRPLRHADTSCLVSLTALAASGA